MTPFACQTSDNLLQNATIETEEICEVVLGCRDSCLGSGREGNSNSNSNSDSHDIANASNSQTMVNGFGMSSPQYSTPYKSTGSNSKFSYGVYTSNHFDSDKRNKIGSDSSEVSSISPLVNHPKSGKDVPLRSTNIVPDKIVQESRYSDMKTEENFGITSIPMDSSEVMRTHEESSMSPLIVQPPATP